MPEQELAREGLAVASLLRIAAAAYQLCHDSSRRASNSKEGPEEPAPAAATAAVGTALQAVLERALQGLVDESTSGEDEESHVDAVQGVVRALDAPQASREPASADAQAPEASDDQQATEVDGYRDAMWAALQQYVATAPTSQAASHTHVHILDILSALSQASSDGGSGSQPSRWGSWRAPATGEIAGGAPDSLLLSCTAALVAPLWPAGQVQVMAADVTDTRAAGALFQRLLAHSRGAQQLSALAELLNSTWRNGALLAERVTAEAVPEEEASAARGGPADSEPADPEPAAAQAALADFDDAWGAEDEGAVTTSEAGDCWVPQQEASVDEDVDVCALHACWAALLAAMVRQGHEGLAIKQLDLAEGAAVLLTAVEAHDLARTVAQVCGMCLPATFAVASPSCYQCNGRHFAVCEHLISKLAGAKVSYNLMASPQHGPEGTPRY